MSPSTRIWSTFGRAASTASRASRLAWTSESRARTGPEPDSGVDAFVSVLKEDANGGRHRHRDEKSEDTAQVAANHEGDDDQHGAEVDSVTEHLGRDEVVDDVGDDEVEDQYGDDFAG